MKELLEFIETLTELTMKMQGAMSEDRDGVQTYSKELKQYCEWFDILKRQIPGNIYAIYEEFFSQFTYFCNMCLDPDFCFKNRKQLQESLDLVAECLKDMEERCLMNSGVCTCCGNEVMYLPLDPYYAKMSEKYKAPKALDETLNPNAYTCPKCGSSDRDRMIISFLSKIGIEEADEGTRVLQIAPAHSIDAWLRLHCPQLCYETADLFMAGVDFKVDIQNMKEIPDQTYDIIICSHVLEHVQNDRLALQEMRRILKDDGRIVFLVPVDLNVHEIDEEWGCSEEENWRRFGQGDHCRKYSHEGLVARLEEQFFVHQLGIEYFGEDIFQDCGLLDTSTLYVLTKNKKAKLELNVELDIDYDLCENGPLVSVILPCYNHAPFVAEAIESVIHQSYKNIEFIIGDDASTDETPLIMRRYSHYYAKEIYYQENAGGRDQELSKFATGKYIALMHSDDIWDVNKIAVQVEYMEKHPNCGACFTWCDYVDESLNRLRDFVFIQPNRTRAEWINYFWKNGNALCNPSSLIRNDLIFHTVRYGAENRQLPDLFKWVNFVENFDIHIITKRMTLMRRYNKDGRQNTSAITPQTKIRTIFEYGSTWLPIIRNMQDELFVESFRDMLTDKTVTNPKEIKCEKFFLMLQSQNVFVQLSALYYYNEILVDVKEVLEGKYGYTGKQYRTDEIEKGLGPILEGLLSKKG